jgi:hypothetical protein
MITHKFLPKKTAICMILYLITIIIFSIHYVMDFKSDSLFDFINHPVGGGSASTFTILYGVFPFIAILLPRVIDNLEKDTVILRIRQKRKLLYHYFAFSLIISACITILMALTGVLAAYLFTGNVQNLWQYESGSFYFYLENKSVFSIYIPYLSSVKIWLYLLFSRFLGIFTFSALIIFLKQVCKKNSYVFFFTLFLFGAESLFSKRINILFGYMHIEKETWISPSDQLFAIFYFLFWIVLFFIICQKLFDKKEFL